MGEKGVALRRVVGRIKAAIQSEHSLPADGRTIIKLSAYRMEDGLGRARRQSCTRHGHVHGEHRPQCGQGHERVAARRPRGRSRKYDARASFRAEAVSTQTGGGAFRVSWFETDNCRRHSVIGAHTRIPGMPGWQTVRADGLLAPSTVASAGIDLIQSVNSSGACSNHGVRANFSVILANTLFWHP